MSKEEKAALNTDAAKFVKEIVTKVYGQRASQKTVSVTAKRVVASVLSVRSVGQ